MDEILALISQKLRTMIEAANPSSIFSRHKAITAFFPYVVWHEQNGQHKMLNTFLCAVGSGNWGFMWHRIEPLIATLLNEENSISLKQTTILISPHLPWWRFTNIKHLTQQLEATASTVPCTDKISQCMVDTLLQIALNPSLQPQIPHDMWLWLNVCPILPPTCMGHQLGSAPSVVKAVQALGDIEILKSYLFLVWSEWSCLSGQLYCYSTQPHSSEGGFPEMCTLIRENFSGIGMGLHQEDLLQLLDCILGQLDLGLDHLQQGNPGLDKSTAQGMKEQYRKLKEVLLEVARTGGD